MKGKAFDRSVAVAVGGIDFMHILRVQFDCDRSDTDFWLYDFFEERGSGNRPAGNDLKRWLGNFRKQAQESGDFTTRTLAIIRDAEDDRAAQFSSVCSALRSVGLPEPSANGEFTSGSWEGNPMRVGILIIPSDAESGCLESCLLRAPKQDFALEPAREFQRTTEAAAREVPEFREVIEGKTPGGLTRWQEKVKVRAMIAAGPASPGQTLGASGTWLWDFNRSPLKEIMDFIQAARSTEA
jgi:hypothetical protein